MPPASLQKNSHILLHVFCLHFIKTHHASSEEALKVCEQNFFQKILVKSINLLLNYDKITRQLPSC